MTYEPDTKTAKTTFNEHETAAAGRVNRNQRSFPVDNKSVILSVSGRTRTHQINYGRGRHLGQSKRQPPKDTVNVNQKVWQLRQISQVPPAGFGGRLYQYLITVKI